jgi:uncharacterized protein
MREQRPPLPPFTFETAVERVRKAEDAWNTRDPFNVALAYTTDSIWRNRSEFLVGREAIVAFLTRKWNRELDYRLINEIWTFRDNRIAVAYEWHDDSFNWFRSYGNENWEFGPEIAKWHRQLPDPLKAMIDVQAERIVVVQDPEGAFAVRRTASKDNPEALQGFHAVCHPLATKPENRLSLAASSRGERAEDRTGVQTP